MSLKELETPSLEEQLKKSLELTRCPHCNVMNPVIRAVPAYKSPCGTIVIFSCLSCKRIISCGLAPMELLASL